MSESAIIDGRSIAAQIYHQLTERIAEATAIQGFPPGLAVILVGEDPNSQIYVRAKRHALTQVGMCASDYHLPANVSQSALLDQIERLNHMPEVNGILVQLPLPQSIDPHAVLMAIDPTKDVDGFHPLNAGLLAIGRPFIVPCTPLGCLLLLRHTIADLTGYHAIIIGRSSIVGRPMAQLLLLKDCTVTMTHSRTKDLAEVCRKADIIVVAVGKPEFVRGSWIKPGAVILDVGINLRATGEERKRQLIGDVAFSEARSVAAAITPVPGGVGPMTIAGLVINTLAVTCRRIGIDLPPESIL